MIGIRSFLKSTLTSFFLSGIWYGVMADDYNFEAYVSWMECSRYIYFS